MTNTATVAAQEPKKDKNQRSPLKDPFNEYVTVRRFIGQKGMGLPEVEFIKDQPNIQAIRGVGKDGKQEFLLRHAGEGGVNASVATKSEIIDKDGVVWVVTKGSGAADDDLHVQVDKKAEKKP